MDDYECPPPIECPIITTAEIERAVRRASPNKAPGADGISNSILHQMLEILLPVFSSSSTHASNRATVRRTSMTPSQ
jgi:hypothetical protein